MEVTNTKKRSREIAARTVPKSKTRMDFFMGMTKKLLLSGLENGFHENLVLSPSLIDIVLNMVAAGLTGQALEQMLVSLWSKDIEEVNSRSLEMMKGVAGDGLDGPTLCMVNGAWVDESIHLQPSYKEVLKDIYECEAKIVDFVTRADEVVNEVNTWAEVASRGLIKNLLQPGSLAPVPALILANGLYFKGTWTHRHRFDVKLTKNRDFYLLNGGKVSVPFMTSHGWYDCRQFDGFKVLRIPYESGAVRRRFCMYFFLPDEQDGLQNLLEKLSSGCDFSYFCLGKADLKEFWIPKFKFSYGFDVSNTMHDMGTPLPPVQNLVNVAEMVDIPKGLRFPAPKMFRKAYIEVDEKGTKAAASLHLMAAGYAMVRPEKLSFVADHPFMFMIKEDSEVVFFTGAVLDPSKVI